MIPNLGDRWERDFDDFTVRTFDFDARCGERLGGFQAVYGSTYSTAIGRYDFNVRFAVKGLQGCQGFSYLQVIVAFPRPKEAPLQFNLPGDVTCQPV